jgi:hypothetical protein
MPIVIAVGLGPLIAGLAVSAYAVGGGGFDDIADLLDMCSVYIGLSYLLGGAIALVAGTLVSIWMIWRPLNALVVIAAAVIATCGYMGVGALGVLGPAEVTNARSNLLFTLVLAVIAAVGCWLLTGRFAKST